MHKLIINCKSQKAKEKTIAFCDTVLIFLMLLLRAPVCELVKNIYCDFCRTCQTYIAMVNKYCHISWNKTLIHESKTWMLSVLLALSLGPLV